MFALGGLGLVAALVATAVLPPAGAHERATAVPDPDDLISEVPVATPAQRAAREAARAGDVAAAAALVRADLDRARASGDPRFLGQAEATLMPWHDQAAPPAPLLLLRATVRQALHDFTGARRDLDALIAASPDDAQAHLTRAVVAAVTGDRATADADCAVVTRTAGELWGAACAAPLAAAHGRGPAARARLANAIAASRDARAAAWATTSLGELDRQLGDDASAELALRTALAADPDDPYTLAALADLLLDGDRAAEALALVGERPAEALVLRRAIALERTHAPAAAALRATLAERFAAGAARGDRLHLRERARFELEVLHDPRAAVATAVANWALQREPADARVLLDAALAAADPAAAAPVLAWLAAERIDDVGLRTRAAALGGAR